MRSRILGLVVVLVLGLGAMSLPVAAGVFTAEGSFDRTLKVTGPVDLDIETGSGSITVRPGEGGSVHVIGTIKARSDLGLNTREAEEKVRQLEANPPIVQTGNTIRLGYIEDRELRRNVSISYEVTVPRETKLRSRTGSGSQTVDGIQGPVYAETGSGSLTITSIGSEVEAETGSGGIELRAIQGRVKADTGSGSIRGVQVAGPVVASTGSGSVDLEVTAPGDIAVDTGSGGVEVRGVHGGLVVETGSGSVSVDGEPVRGWNLSTGSGNITVQLPNQAAFDLDARTSSGGIYTDHPITVQGSIGKRELHGKVRGGGALLALSTGSGNIRIE